MTECRHQNSGFTFGLILGAVVAAVIAVVIYRQRDTQILKNFKKKLEDYISQAFIPGKNISKKKDKKKNSRTRGSSPKKIARKLNPRQFIRT